MAGILLLELENRILSFFIRWLYSLDILCVLSITSARFGHSSRVKSNNRIEGRAAHLLELLDWTVCLRPGGARGLTRYQREGTKASADQKGDGVVGNRD